MTDEPDWAGKLRRPRCVACPAWGCAPMTDGCWFTWAEVRVAERSEPVAWVATYAPQVRW